MVIEVTYNVTDVYMSTTVSPIYITVDYSGTGGGGSSVWGAITGTLSNQTDLQTALDGKFDDPTGTSLQYIDGTGAVQTFPLTLPVLQEVRNQTGATLDAGTVVYINGATGNKPTVTKAIATGDSTSAQTLGMVSAEISNNGTGYVVVIGTCSGLDTSAYTEGQQLYLSGTTAGGVTTTKPYAPIHLVYVGIVTRSHPTLGTIEVRVQNGYELSEIHDVSAQNPSNNDGIFYNSGNSLWEHKPISTVLGYTPEQPLTFSSPLSRSTNTVSIPVASSSANGYLSSTDWSTFNSKQGALTLTTTGTSGAATLVGSTLNIPQYSGGGGMAIGGSITSATAGSVLFAGTSGVLAQDNSNLFWDDTNDRLGIRTSSPNASLHVSGSTTASGAIARGSNFTPTLVAAANNDVLVGLDVNPTFTNGAFTGVSNYAARITGGLVVNAANNVNVFTNTLIDREVFSLINLTNGNTFSAFTSRRYDGLEVMGMGYGNPGGSAPFADTVFLESSRYYNYNTNTKGSGTPPDIAIVQSEYDNGLAGQSLRRRMLFSGTDYSINLYRKGSASGSGVPTGNTIAFSLDLNGKLTLSGSTNVSDSHNLISTGSAIRSLKLKVNNSDGYAAAFLHDYLDVEKAAFGYGNTSSSPITYADTFFIATFSTIPIKLITNNSERFRVFPSSGNILIQSGGTFTDSGERLQVTGTAKITSKLSMGAGTTSAAQINLASSTAPTSPANGDIWFDGTDIKMRIGGVTKTFTLI